jgi:protein-tyrosine phosphatase
MELYQVDDDARLFISPDIDDWAPLVERGIQGVFDLDDDVDIGVPCIPNQLLYIFLPIEDGELPDLQRLHAVAHMGAGLVRAGRPVLSHCGMGHNRSALLAGLILTHLGMSGEEAVARLRERRQGALYNKVFASYLGTIQRGGATTRDGMLVLQA